VKRSRSFAPPLLRVVSVTTALAFSWLAVVASCSKSRKDPGIRVDPAMSCPARSDVTRCSGNDPTFVFFPALSCEPSSGDDGGLGDATPDGDETTEASNDAVVDESNDGGDGAVVDESNDGGDGAVLDVSAEGGAGDANPCALVTSLDVFFTPQACQAFVSAEANRNIALASDPSAPVITEPADGDALTPDNWSIFVWDWPQRDSRRDWLKRAVDLVEPSAYAYSPLKGDAYVLEFTQGCTEILRVMLAEQLWLPDPTSWALLTSLTGPVQVRVFWMRFAGDVLVSKPVPSLPITITMQVDAGD
jgi:hypothetical protein